METPPSPRPGRLLCWGSTGRVRRALGPSRAFAPWHGLGASPRSRCPQPRHQDEGRGELVRVPREVAQQPVCATRCPVPCAHFLHSAWSLVLAGSVDAPGACCGSVGRHPLGVKSLWACGAAGRRADRRAGGGWKEWHSYKAWRVPGPQGAAGWRLGELTSWPPPLQREAGPSVPPTASPARTRLTTDIRQGRRLHPVHPIRCYLIQKYLTETSRILFG